MSHDDDVAMSSPFRRTVRNVGVPFFWLETVFSIENSPVPGGEIFELYANSSSQDDGLHDGAKREHQATQERVGNENRQENKWKFPKKRRRHYGAPERDRSRPILLAKFGPPMADNKETKRHDRKGPT